ncbi:MAG: ATP-binding cassette domain-containing protein [Sideroxydans sp.]|nr:ATP-binding cassette domain-containing protein [Sideroxydans sp.]
MSFVEVSGFAKSYGGNTVFEDINFVLARGEFVTLLGPSGCGKSTLLRCLAGLVSLDAGQFRVEGEDITYAVPQKRGIGMVFQSYALFPNMTVSQNIAFGLKMQKLAAKVVASKVAEAIELVELGGKERAYPAALSGGQRQRVALARSLVVEPRILLLDEPLSALDARIRRSLRQQILDIQRRLDLTTIFVTHDQEEALTLSDRIFVMDRGRIVQQGSAETVYTRPANEAVARFMGNYNLLGPQESRLLLGLDIDGHLAIRPEVIRLFAADDVTPGLIPATVMHSQLLGNVVRYQVEAKGVALQIDCLNRRAADLLSDGNRVMLHIAPEDLQEIAP